MVAMAVALFMTICLFSMHRLASGLYGCAKQLNVVLQVTPVMFHLVQIWFTLKTKQYRRWVSSASSRKTYWYSHIMSEHRQQASVSPVFHCRGSKISKWLHFQIPSSVWTSDAVCTYLTTIHIYLLSFLLFKRNFPVHIARMSDY